MKLNLHQTNKLYTMKKTIFITLLACLTIFNGFAQEEEENQGLKGAWWALGQLQFTDSEADDTSSFTILPVVGTFVSPTVTIGLGLGYTSTKVGNADADGALIVMPLVRNYWGINDKLYIFGQADVPMMFFDDATAYGFIVRPWIDYFLSGKVTIEATFGQFGYNAVKPKNGDAVGTTSLGFNFMEVNFGIKLIL